MVGSCEVPGRLGAGGQEVQFPFHGFVGVFSWHPSVGQYVFLDRPVWSAFQWGGRAGTGCGVDVEPCEHFVALQAESHEDRVLPTDVRLPKGVLRLRERLRIRSRSNLRNTCKFDIYAVHVGGAYIFDGSELGIKEGQVYAFADRAPVDDALKSTLFDELA